MIAWVAAVGALAGEPSPQALVYYNARMALREGQPLEALKLWLLRNTLEDQTGLISAYDDDFRSVTWAALGDLGVCQDGYPVDADGAGLWPVAMHNWVVRNVGRRVVRASRPFDAFDVGRQARRITVNDVLSAEELAVVQVSPGRCLRPRLLLLEMGEEPWAKPSTPDVAAKLMLNLLDRATHSIAGDHVEGAAAIAARRFDLHLELLEIAAREARLLARRQAGLGRDAGLSRASLAAMDEDAPTHLFSAHSAPAEILRACVAWPASEWMALSPERRLFLFDQARDYGGDPRALDPTVLGILDALPAAGEGDQVEAWIARFGGADEPVGRAVIWSGDRGAALLALDRESGFRERAIIAIYRGVSQLEQGDLRGALRSLAYALQQASDSAANEEVQRLSRRWLSYTASQFESTSEMLVTLQELVPARDYAIILEDLMWRAALRADRASFDRGNRAGSSRSGGRAALDRRLALLQPLASGDLGGFAAQVRGGLSASPSETLRFLDQLVVRLELEELEVRGRHLTTLRRVRELVAPLTIAPDEGAPSRQSRSADALMDRAQAILDALQPQGGDASAQDRARALAPTGEVFAGSVRLAPADPLPWPFLASPAVPPSVFEPLDLTPREWRDPSGALVFGWSIGG